MTEIFRLVDVETRTITTDRRGYAGNAFDNQSTTIKFTLQKRGEDWDPTENGYRPFLVAAVYDEDGNPFVYSTDTAPMFDGYQFQIPWELTSRLASNRLEYCLWFVKTEVADIFNGTSDNLLRTEYLLTATDSIAIKPSIRPKGPRCGCDPVLPYAPSTSPSIIGNQEFMRDNALILPVDLMGRMENGLPRGLDLMFHTLSGQLQTLYFNVPTLDTDGQIGSYYLPVGNAANKLVQLAASVGKGQAIVFDSSVGFKGANVAQSLEYVAYREEGEDVKRHLVILKDVNGTALSTIDLPLEDLVDSVDYDPVTKKIWFRFDDPERDFFIPVNDLADIYEPVEGELSVSPGTGGVAGENTVYTIGLAPEFKEKLKANIDRLDGRIDSHLVDIANPHKVTKAQVGLGNADNTSDADKPVSTAQRTYIDAVRDYATQISEECTSRNTAVNTRIDEAVASIQALDLRESKVTQDTNKALDARYDKSEVDKLLLGKMDVMTAGDHIVFRDGKINVDPSQLVFEADSELSQASTRPIQNQAVTKALAKKNPVIVAGDKIKITSNTDGTQTISATQPTIEVDTELNALSVNPVQNKVIKRALDGKANIGEGVSVWKGQTSDGVNYLYQSGDVVVYDWNLYVSKVDNNDHHPTDEDCWNVVRSGAVSKEIGLTAATYIGVFGNEVDTEYTIEHKLGSRNLVFSFMRADGSYSFVTNAVVSAPTLNTIRVKLTSPPGVNAIAVNIIKAKTYREGAATEYPRIVNINEPAVRWTVENDTNLPLYIKAYDENGNDLMGDIVQSSLSAFDPVTISFTEAHSGKVVAASTDESHVYLQQDLAGTPVTLVENEGSDRYLVQCFKDGEGQSRLDIIQHDGKITVCATDVSHWTGYVALYKASAVKAFTASELKEETAGDGTKVYTLTYQHNKNRMVCAQVYAGEDGLALADIHCPTDNTVKIYLNARISGELLVL